MRFQQFIFLLFFLPCIAVSAPTVINFSQVDAYTGTDTLVSRVGIANFSSSLYSHPDGFQDYGGGVYNWYGERREYITFSQSVQLISLVVRQLSEFGNLPLPSSMIFEMYDSSNALIATKTVAVGTTLQTVTFSQNNVAKLLFDFTGGGAAYDDVRTHGWYFLDDITLDTVAVPEPNVWILLLAGMLLVSKFFRK